MTLTNWGLLFLILISLILYTAETEQEFGIREAGAIGFLNIAILAVFGIEFVLRLYVAGIDERFGGWRGLRGYAKSNWFMMTVDFLAFAPALLLLAIGLSPPSWLRALRVARLFKMARYISRRARSSPKSLAVSRVRCGGAS